MYRRNKENFTSSNSTRKNSIRVFKKTIKERFISTKTVILNGEKILIACENNNINIQTFKKILTFNEYEYIEYFKDKNDEERLVRINSKNELILQARNMYSNGILISEIARQTGYSRKTIRKYIYPSYIVTIDNTKRERTNICSPYHNLIVDLVSRNTMIKSIYKAIVEKGYQGKYGMVKKYIADIKKSKEIFFEKTLKRKYLVKHLFNPLNTNSELSREYLKKIYIKYPFIKTIVELMLEFKGILLKTKKEKALNAWLNKASAIKLDKINSFVKGCKNDWQAVVNSIKYDYSNGIVESSVNKIKLVKRIMHGRCSFETLRFKTLRLEFLRSFN